MAIKSTFKILVLSILIITILNCPYADTGPHIGENQAKNVAQHYLSSHNLPYKVTTETNLVKIKNKKTGETKWVTWPQWKEMTESWYNTTGDPYVVEHFEWTKTGIYEINKTVYDTAWKITVVDKQGNRVGSIWINDITGSITKIDLKPVGNTASNLTTNTTNTTIPTSQGSSDSNTGLVYCIVSLIIAIGAGYLIYNRI